MVRHPGDGRVHFSELKAMAKSPAHFVEACRAAKTPTRAMTVGAVGDCIVFGNRGYAIYPGKVRNGKEWEAWRAAHPGVIHCIQSEVDDARGAADAVLGDPVSSAVLSVHDAEYQVCARWEAYGLDCAAGIPGERGGFDMVGTVSPLMAEMVPGVVPGNTFVADLKITSSTEPYDFSVHAWKSMWHAQLSWYVDGIEAGGGRADHQLLIGVEPNPPHNVTVLLVPPDLIEDGRRSIALWAEKLRACDRTGLFPGYTQRGEVMVRPNWLTSEDSG